MLAQPKNTACRAAPRAINLVSSSPLSAHWIASRRRRVPRYRCSTSGLGRLLWKQVWVKRFLLGHRLCCKGANEQSNYTTIGLSMQSRIFGISRAAHFHRYKKKSRTSYPIPTRTSTVPTFNKISKAIALFISIPSSVSDFQENVTEDPKSYMEIDILSDITRGGASRWVILFVP